MPRQPETKTGFYKLTDARPEPWWKIAARTLAHNAVFNVTARILMMATFGLASLIVTYEISQAQSLVKVVARATVLETKVDPLVSNVASITSQVYNLSGRMDKMETRGDIAKADREKNQDQTVALLSKMTDVQSNILQQLAALNAHLGDIDQRLNRLENQRGTQ